jgi:uncharacterized repeat protein (TIGR03803 family)
MAGHRNTCISAILLLALVSSIVGATATFAQNVPATAREAAKLPQFAGRLAHPAAAAQQGSPASATAQHRAAMGGRAEPSGPPSSLWRNYLPPDVLYSNGPINGTTDAWTINFGFVTTDSFPGGGGQVTGLSFGAWLFPGDVLQSVEVSIGSSPFGNDILDQVVNLSQSSCAGNQYGFNVCVESGNLGTETLNGGTYWVSLQNAQVNSGDPAYWDENSGPSMAEESSVGTIPSEAFTLAGSVNHEQQCLTSQGPVQIIHSFTQQEGAPNGVVIDAAGNLYGTSPFGGDDSQGFAYKLNRFADWLLDPLFNFLGGSSGYQPNGVIVGPNGTLYGGAQGGIQNCGGDGSQYCGLVYNLTPQPTTCANATCGWREKVLYRFSSENDGGAFVYVSAYDRNGNLYGVTAGGGAFGAGTVFELTPSGGGWTKNTLYSFTGRFDGGDPNTVLVGTDGNLYGTTYTGGMLNQGVVFQLTPSGGGWTESVIQGFPQYTLGLPRYLVQDNLGNLYGILGIGSDASMYPPAIFRLQKDGSGWDYSEKFVHEDYVGILNNLTIDAGGNLYGTGGYGYLHPDLAAYIFKASYDSRGWHYEDLEIVDNPTFGFGGSLAVDSSGNLYGVTGGCGTYNVGTLWQLSP